MDYDLEEEVPVLARREYRQFEHDYHRHLRLHGVSNFAATARDVFSEGTMTTKIKSTQFSADLTASCHYLR
jgi:hypothetical protein